MISVDSDTKVDEADLTADVVLVSIERIRAFELTIKEAPKKVTTDVDEPGCLPQHPTRRIPLRTTNPTQDTARRTEPAARSKRIKNHKS